MVIELTRRLSTTIGGSDGTCPIAATVGGPSPSSTRLVRRSSLVMPNCEHHHSAAAPSPANADGGSMSKSISRASLSTASPPTTLGSRCHSIKRSLVVGGTFQVADCGTNARCTATSTFPLLRGRNFIAVSSVGSSGTSAVATTCPQTARFSSVMYPLPCRPPPATLAWWMLACGSIAPSGLLIARHGKAARYTYIKPHTPPISPL